MTFIPTPELAHLIEGRRIAQRLESEGLSLNLDQGQLVELGRASLGPGHEWASHELAQSRAMPSDMVEFMAQLRVKDLAQELDQDQVQGNGQDPRTAPNHVPWNRSDISDIGAGARSGRAQVDPSARGVPGSAVRFEKNDQNENGGRS